jgi:predicted phage tail protein
MLRKIKLHGFIGKKYAKQVTVDCDNMFQAMRALQSIFGPSFKEDIRNHNWHIVDGKVKAGNDLDGEELDMPLKSKELHLIPAVAGGSGALRVVLGLVLVVAGAFFAQPWLVNIGIAMTLGGAIEMLVKPPTTNTPNQETNNDAGSYIYNGALNVTSQGGPIPLIYGRMYHASSVVITTDFSSDDITS